MRNLLRLILPLLMLQGCAGNPVAQQLERSFDQPAATSSGSDPSDRSERTRDSKPESKQQPTSKARSQATSEPTSKTDPPTAADTRPENAPTEQDRLDKPELKADQAGDDQGGDDQTEDNKAADKMLRRPRMPWSCRPRICLRSLIGSPSACPQPTLLRRPRRSPVSCERPVFPSPSSGSSGLSHES